MELMVTVFALVGFVAVGLRLLRSGLRALIWATDAFAARERARTRARRGDLTGMAEAQGQVSSARRARWHAMAEVALWLVLLVAPPLTSWTRALYALYGAAAIVVWGARAALPGSLSLPGWHNR